jgi:hypothetical protein
MAPLLDLCAPFPLCLLEEDLHPFACPFACCPCLCLNALLMKCTLTLGAPFLHNKCAPPMVHPSSSNAHPLPQVRPSQAMCLLKAWCALNKVRPLKASLLLQTLFSSLPLLHSNLQVNNEPPFSPFASFSLILRLT